MGGFFDKVKDVWSGAGDMFSEVLLDPRDLTGAGAADAAREGAALTAQGQREQLDYLKEINKLPQEYREQALTELAGVYSGTDPGKQQEMIDRAKASPLYQEIMSGRAAGEEGVARAASVTGGLRSGNVNDALYKYNTELKNKALTETYGQQMTGLKGLAGLVTKESEIGDIMGGIGDTLGMGRIAAGQAMQSGAENTANLGLGIASMFI